MPSLGDCEAGLLNNNPCIEIWGRLAALALNARQVKVGSLLCKCASCPDEGKFFQANEIAGHRASVAMIQRRCHDTTHSFRQQLTGPVPDSVILESVGRLINMDYPNPSRVTAARLPDPSGSADDEDDEFCTATSHSVRNKLFDVAGLLRQIASSLQGESRRLQALEQSISPWSPAKSQELLSVEREVTRMRLEVGTATRNVACVSKARDEIQLLWNCIEARILEIKTLVALTSTGSTLREVDCGESCFGTQGAGLMPVLRFERTLTIPSAK